MGLTQKILLFTGALVIALVATTLAFTTVQADRLAHRTINQGLSDTRGVWETFQADRYAKLKLGIRVLGNDPYFKAAVETNDQATILDTLKERNLELKADFFIATDPAGIVIARTDRPGAQGEDLSSDPLVTASMEGEESATIWRQADKLYHAVSVPMQTGPDLKGVLIAGYGINESVASYIRRITQSEIAYLTQEPGRPPRLSVSSLGSEEPALANALSHPEFSTPEAGAQPFPIDLGGEPHVAVVTPLKAASGETLGSVVALRSLAVEMASFVQFRNSLVLVSLVVMILGLALAYVAARGITGPVRKLVRLVERARDGSYSGAVSVATSDEIGVLARTFNGLLTDLREKEQMIGFLRDGMTMLRKAPGASVEEDAVGNARTLGLKDVTAAGPGVEGEGGKAGLFAGRYATTDTTAAAHQHEDAPVSRTVQGTIGLLIGTTIYGVALGGLLALVYAFAGGRVGPLSISELKPTRVDKKSGRVRFFLV
jgi:serine/threonine-protein kinase